MRESTVGWIFVLVQLALFAALLVAPSSADWQVGTGLRFLGVGLVGLGCALGAAASLGLGRGFTPSPVPSDRGELRTTGLFALVRHPVYSGVLLAVAGVVLRSGSLLSVGLGAAILLFLIGKAAWEERRLVARYPGYAEYAARTPRFVPWPSRR